MVSAARTVTRPAGELLGHPGVVGVRAAACEVDAPAAKLDEEQGVQALQPDGLDREEVSRDHRFRLCPQERAPGKAAAVARRAEPCVSEELCGRLWPRR